MYGFYGRILKVDLSNESYSIEKTPAEVIARLLGGKGLASHLLLTLNPAGTDPLGPENRLIFATGAASGSAVWGSSRYGVFTKSPLTGLYAESYSGGRVPEAIDAAGYDAVVLEGQSAAPTVLAIHPEGVSFHPAGDIWGMETYEAEDAAVSRFADPTHKKRGAVVIGPAGENGVLFAAIENDHGRFAGRAGVGAVMGSKSVKAIVFSGDRRREPADRKRVLAQSRELAAESKENPGVAAYKSMGTSQMVKIMNGAGAFPTRYWSEGTYDKWEGISADALHTRCDVTPHACAKCFMACGRKTTVKVGRHAGLTLHGPEYETIFAFGGLCMVDSIEEVAHLNDICDRMGMDTITAGNLAAFTIEASLRGKIDYAISYGDVDTIAGLLMLIARREGIGETLSRGIRHAAKEWDLEDIAVHVKGMEPAGYDPRVLKGMGLGFATSDRGACHLRATFYKPELAGMIDKDTTEGKAELFVDFEDRLTLFDTFVLCRFFRDLYPWEQLSTMVGALTGLPADKEELREIAAAISTTVRRFNIREGLVPADDRLPARLHKKLADSGKVITPEELDTMVADYYRLRGWDEAGRPLGE